jgi:hypothetical protein
MKVKIREIRTAGLKGATPRGEWSTELVQEDSVHTLVVVFTDEGVTGVGGVFTNSDLVRAALAVMEPLYRDENALEPERVSETQQNGQR